MTDEVELKFRAATDAPLVELARRDRLAATSLGPPISHREEDIYLDTPDRRLGRSRWACRIRTREGRTIVSLKGSARSDGPSGLHRRPEVEGPATWPGGPATWPASEARSLLEKLADGAPLEERLTLRQERTERIVTSSAGRHIGVLSLDTSDVVVSGTLRERLYTVELELGAVADEAELAALRGALLEVEGIAPDPVTKLERALAAAGLPAEPR
ncbi:MAG: inorganic triphosphatase [Candidatus Limnocylindria bacterium]